MDNFYSSGCVDRCTLVSDKVLINRHNVVTEAKRNYAAPKRFLCLAFESHVVAAAMTLLGIERMDDQPKTSTVPEPLQHLGKSERKDVLTNLAAKVVDQFVLEKKLLRECYKQKKTWKKKSYRW